MTQLLYLADTYLFESAAKVILQNEDYVIFDQTIFYPQGGGQPCDQGIIATSDHEVFVNSVHVVDDEVRHYGQFPDTPLNDVVCRIDQTRRLLNAKHHTAGHLLAGVIEKARPQLTATKCHAFPGEAYVEFLGGGELQSQVIQELASQAIWQGISTQIFEIDLQSFENKYYKLHYPIPANKPFRVLQIGDYKPVPCGGTHLSNTNEIGRIMVKKVKAKDGVLKVSYEVCEPH
jgi:alanyl-tRNA synthetase